MDQGVDVLFNVSPDMDAAHQPDFGPSVRASQTVAAHIRRGAIVIYESTVCPGATEEICVPIIEKRSGLK